jgi:hypothetical protein
VLFSTNRQRDFRLLAGADEEINAMIGHALRRTILAAVASLVAASSTAFACDCDGHYRYRHEEAGNYSCYGGGYDCHYEGSYYRSAYHHYRNDYYGYYRHRGYDSYHRRDCDHDCRQSITSASPSLRQPWRPGGRLR